jgi:hypothetical protein
MSSIKIEDLRIVLEMAVTAPMQTYAAAIEMKPSVDKFGQLYKAMESGFQLAVVSHEELELLSRFRSTRTEAAKAGQADMRGGVIVGPGQLPPAEFIDPITE